MFARIDHIGVAVESIDDALKLYDVSYEMTLVHREVVEEQGVEAVLLDVGENHVELLQPLGPDTPVGRYLAKRGPGIHHVAYQVTDIDAELELPAADRWHAAGVAGVAGRFPACTAHPVSYTHLRAHETVLDLVGRLLLEQKKKNTQTSIHPPARCLRPKTATSNPPSLRRAT